MRLMISNKKTMKNLRVNNPKPSLSIELVNLIYFDIETTGLRPDRGAEIIEVSILDRNSQLLSWSKEFREQSDNIYELLPVIIDFFKRGVVVGHNLPFDFWFISHEANKLGTDGLSLQFIDTLSLARKVLPGNNSYRLAELLKEFDINVSGELHTAITDSEATRALFWKLIEKGGISTVGEAGMKQLNWSNF